MAVAEITPENSIGLTAVEAHYSQSGATHRPILTYANGDTCWLISLPRPAAEVTPGSKRFVHLLIDPWFGKDSIAYSPIFLKMYPAREPAMKGRADIDAVIADIERAAANGEQTPEGLTVDAIGVMGEVGDHCDKEALLQYPKSTPIFSSRRATSMVESYNYFENIIVMEPRDLSGQSGTWRTAEEEAGTSASPLPPWVTLFSPKVSLYNCFGIAVVWAADSTYKDSEWILFAPHGIMAADMVNMATKTPATRNLAVVGPLKETTTALIKTGLGADQGIKLASETGGKYMIRSGDRPLTYSGLVSWVIQDFKHDFQWGLDQLKQSGENMDKLKPPRYGEVANGGSVVLL